MVVNPVGLLLVTSLFVTTACSPTRRSVPVPEQRNERLPANQDAEGTVTFEDRRSTEEPTRTEAGDDRDKVVSLPLILKASTLKSSYPDLDLAKLRYHFTFLQTEERGPLAFNNGVARLTLKDLTVGRSGKLVFEIYESDSLKFKGVNDNLVLKESNNADFKLNLRLASDSDQSTSVDIEVELDDSGNTSTDAEDDQTSTEDDSADQDQNALALWDGRSFLNSADWKITAR